jgi:hypothetical protein
VVKCIRISTGELFSVKIIKNKPNYKNQSCMEIEILKKVAISQMLQVPILMPLFVVNVD